MKLSLFLLLTLPSLLFSASPEISLLPSARLIAPFTANAVEHRVSLRKNTNENLYTGSLGGVIPLAELAFDGGMRAQLTLGGTFYTSLSSEAHQYVVTNGDYYVDIMCDAQLSSSLALRLGLGHTSQHLMDDALESALMPHSINYIRDYLQMFVVTRVDAIGGFLYAGGFYNYTFVIDTHRDGTMIYEAGGEALNYQIAPQLRVFVAMDLKLRGESHFGTTQCYQLGVKLVRGERAARIAMNYHAGLEERGQFFSRRTNFFSLGLYLDL